MQGVCRAFKVRKCTAQDPHTGSRWMEDQNVSRTTSATQSDIRSVAGAVVIRKAVADGAATKCVDGDERGLLKTGRIVRT